MFENVLSRKERPSKKPKATGNGQAASQAGTYGQIDAINRVQAVIQFTVDGTILDANENFLSAIGYRLDEIKGRHHRMFVDPAYAQSQAYADFWAKLRSGEFHSGEFKRFGKGGKEIWILASYNPIFDSNGNLTKVIKFATDVTADKLRNAQYESQIAAIRKTQGVVEFDLDGMVLDANSVFLDLMGYSLAEIKGRHHSMFVEPGEERTEAYREFWRGLKAGRAETRVYKRFAKGGRHVWIQASYNPVLDLDGRPYKVVKFSSDLTSWIDQASSTQFIAQSVAAATEEFSSSIGEITRNMALSRDAAEEIAEMSVESGAAATRLLGSMKSMEQIVTLIGEIAGRVNILALNAAIEAARAGQAGKGFAVVANEVKNLSNQTARATSEIGKEIGAVQAISSQVAGSIQKTAESVAQVRLSVSTVASAMEQQTVVTRSIAQHAAQMVSEMDVLLSKTHTNKQLEAASVGAA